MNVIALSLLGLAAIGLAALTLQRLAVSRHLRAPLPWPKRRVAISVLKPLCGLDEGLAESLEEWASLDYPRYELLLGVRDMNDAAWPMARNLERRFLGKVRVVLQRGEPGLNPKVNQLITLAAQAKNEVLLVSDSNTRPAPGQLFELAALFDDDQVACVTNPVSGWGQRSLGALLDNLHLASSIGPGQIGAKRVAGKDLVVGKSMALRRSALKAIGGFEAFKDVLAEDYVIGTQLRAQKLAVVVAQSPAVNVAIHRPVGSFIKRYLRWSVIHRTAVALPTYGAQALLNPWPLTLVALFLAPSKAMLAASALVLAAKALLDVSSARALTMRVGWKAAAVVPLKDLILFVAWCNGLFQRTIDWRGNRLRVGAGSRLMPVVGSVDLELGRAEA
ncbi:MAG: glycosyltransferase [Myxococcaceae bacterium]